MSLEHLEAALGYTFKDKGLLALAMTHSSYANEEGLPEDYERLEFLGDAVLELLISHMLFKSFPDMSEGDLTKKRAALVCEPSLAAIARRIGIGQYLRLGNGEAQTGGRDRDSILSDALEAALGASFVDGGFTGAQQLVDHLFDAPGKEPQGFGHDDYKSQLQEELQKGGPDPITYEITGETGPQHQKLFSAQVCYKGKILGKGTGKTKKEAEQHAAYHAMQKI